MSLPLGREYLGIIEAARNLGLLVSDPAVTQTTGGTHVVGSEHYDGRAVDFGFNLQGGADNLEALYNAFLPYAQGPGHVIDELFYDPLGGWADGMNIGAIGSHDAHVHVGVKPTVDLAEAMGYPPATASGPGGINPAAYYDGVGTAGWSPWMDADELVTGLISTATLRSGADFWPYATNAEANAAARAGDDVRGAPSNVGRRISASASWFAAGRYGALREHVFREIDVAYALANKPTYPPSLFDDENFEYQVDWDYIPESTGSPYAGQAVEWESDDPGVLIPGGQVAVTQAAPSTWTNPDANPPGFGHHFPVVVAPGPTWAWGTTPLDDAWDYTAAAAGLSLGTVWVRATMDGDVLFDGVSSQPDLSPYVGANGRLALVIRAGLGDLDGERLTEIAPSTFFRGEVAAASLNLDLRVKVRYPRFRYWRPGGTTPTGPCAPRMRAFDLTSEVGRRRSSFQGRFNASLH